MVHVGSQSEHISIIFWTKINKVVKQEKFSVKYKKCATSDKSVGELTVRTYSCTLTQCPK